MATTVKGSREYQRNRLSLEGYPEVYESRIESGQFDVTGGCYVNLDAMSRAELEDLLLRLRRELEDLEETIYFNYRFTSAHIGGKQVRQDEETLRLHKDKIARVATLLAAMGHGRKASEEPR